MFYMGVDTGINSTGIICLNDKMEVEMAENIVIPKGIENRKAKFNYMSDYFYEFLDGIEHLIRGCFMEDHILRRISKKSTSIFDINRLDGRFEQILYSFGIPFSYVQVDHIKQLVDCTTRDKKDLIHDRVLSYYAEDFSSYGNGKMDMADAYILARLLANVPKFKKGPKQFCRRYPNEGAILQNYSAFINLKGDENARSS
jgi:hypothetical protein